MKPQGLPRWLRLRRRREFLRVQRRGQKHHTRHFLVFVAPRSKERWSPARRLAGFSSVDPQKVSNPTPREVTPRTESPALQPTRLGVTVTRKVGRAHERNRIKRLVREVFRQERSQLPPGYDMVWVAKRNAVGFSLEELREDFVTLAGRLNRRHTSASPAKAERGEA